MAGKQVYSICGMCTVRCAIQAEVVRDRVSYIQGNPHAAGVEGALCARGGAGAALIEDRERPQYPMIRSGARGEGKWRRASWAEALDYTAGRLKECRWRAGPWAKGWPTRPSWPGAGVVGPGRRRHGPAGALCDGAQAGGGRAPGILGLQEGE